MYDAIIVGGGHNGLVCAFYLARAGKRVCVLERRGVVGGAAVTEAFHPGFRNSSASYAVSLLNPTVIEEMELARHGLKIVIRPLAYFAPRDDGRHLLMTRDAAETKANIAAFSTKDAEAFDAYEARLDRLVDLLREMLLKTPPNVGGGLSDIMSAAGLGDRVRKLGLPAQRDLIDLFGKSAGEMLDGWFESDALKGILGFDAITGAYATPYMPGTAYVLLHHVFGEVNGVKGAWGHAIGGMGAITQAMARACEAQGVSIRTDAPVASIAIGPDGATGVVLADGGDLEARCVVSSVHPQILFNRMVAPEHLPDDFRERIRTWRSGSGVLRLNVALAEPPNFTSLPSKDVARHHGASMMISPSLDYLDRGYAEARRDGWSSAPAIEMHMPSVLDDTLSPPGQHVASMFCQYFAPTLPDGRSWDEAREAAADAAIETMTRYAPNFKGAILGRKILTPLDLERDFGLIGGDIFHGQLGIDQLFSSRPTLGYADYRSPVRGLYMCGSSTHPGGGVTGAPGRNAAGEILRDLKRGGPRKPRIAA